MSTPAEAYAALVQRFGRAWEKGDTAGIVGLFAPEAVFVPSPFDAPVTGLDGLRRYWRDLPTEQAEIAFRAGEIFAAGPWFATEFRCTFRRRRTGEAVDVRGSLFCETAGDKITEMRMYWHRTVGASR